ncbi:hypothetical protein [Actinophytocola oryzae]|uniref:ABC-type branched-subunit amino acid transport system substrate-binding protein n=1 Tax=Actinophytocola oryzae TaxID=502181 RepID=A0A4R7W1Q3_9PSEU|nr:hypothetical protein [Actinophytocola oryzae]TDV56404.1 ABC-type branched-subunit amino acid transport system substrate-binding protein [Actinophytocola oryzae]
MAERTRGARKLSEPKPFNPPTPWYRRTHTRIIAIVVTLAVIVWMGFWRPWETVRVTDGSDDLFGGLGEVERLIRAENRAVGESGQDYATIAFMMPIRTGDKDPNSRTSIQHELEGAYLAQWWSNHEEGDPVRFSSSRPLVRLLLADTGDGGVDWNDTVTDLVARAESDEHLVAVAGLGSSVDTTQRAVSALNDHGIPTFGSVITSSALSAPRLARVAPTNADEAAAAVAYLTTTPEWLAATPEAPYKIHMVRDTDPNDRYATDLANRYRNAFPRDNPAYPRPTEGGFNAAVGAVGNVLALEAQRICGIDPDVVFFAGFSADLRTFLGKLAARDCAADGPITVICGDDVNRVTGVHGLWTGGSVRVLYTTLATPQAWDSPVAERDKLFSPVPIARFRDGPHSYHAVFGDDLEDGHAIMSYDSVVTAVEATRRARTEKAKVPQPVDLVNGLNQINGTARVPGASGWIYFQIPRNASQQWLPFNKLIPVMSLDANGKATLEALSSNNGRPPGPPPR